MPSTLQDPVHTFFLLSQQSHNPILQIKKVRVREGLPSTKGQVIFVSHTAFPLKQSPFLLNKHTHQKIPTCSEADKGRGKDPNSFSNSFVSLASWFVECCNCCLREKRHVSGYSHSSRAVIVSTVSSQSAPVQGMKGVLEGMGSQRPRFTHTKKKNPEIRLSQTHRKASSCYSVERTYLSETCWSGILTLWGEKKCLSAVLIEI